MQLAGRLWCPPGRLAYLRSCSSARIDPIDSLFASQHDVCSCAAPCDTLQDSVEFVKQALPALQLRCVCDGLRVNRGIEVVHFDNCGIGRGGLKEVVRAAAASASVQSLEVASPGRAVLTRQIVNDESLVEPTEEDVEMADQRGAKKAAYVPRWKTELKECAELVAAVTRETGSSFAHIIDGVRRRACPRRADATLRLGVPTSPTSASTAASWVTLASRA